jgi:glycerophosphoryl diester phosphodiesterase
MVFDPKPAIIGHRGFGAGERNGYRENTLESYLAAVAHGLTWIELDVQRSCDGQLVLRHDPVTENDEFIVSLDASELAASGIPLFEDVMAALPPGVAVNIDVKTIIEDAVDPPDRRTATLVAAALRAHAGRRTLFVSSFDPSLLVYLREQDGFPAPVPLGLITWPGFPVWHAIPAAASLGLDAVCLHTGTLGMHREQPRRMDHTIKKAIGVAHQAGLEVAVWQAGPDNAGMLAAAGADALSVNDVPGVLAALAGDARSPQRITEGSNDE